MQPCVQCNTPTGETIDVMYEDPYGMACSEDNVPCYFVVEEPFCSCCRAKMDFEEQGFGIQDYE